MPAQEQQGSALDETMPGRENTALFQKEWVRVWKLTIQLLLRFPWKHCKFVRDLLFVFHPGKIRSQVVPGTHIQFYILQYFSLSGRSVLRGSLFQSSLQRYAGHARL